VKVLPLINRELTSHEYGNREKLFDVLMLPIVPVFYGDPEVLNITTTPSFIKASDFTSPSALASYLLYLDSHPMEYDKYFAWRHAKRPFTEEYLELAKYIPGPTERKHNIYKPQIWESQRKSNCCRLCDLAYLKRLEDKKDESRLVKPLYKHSFIRKRYFGA
jgi:hypothetical protein